jgi:putative heme iron utilization protein
MSKSPDEEFKKLLNKVQTLHLSSLKENGSPNISYAPFTKDEQGNYYIFISQLAAHTQDLLINPQVSIMLSEDEQDVRQIFARTRVSYDCHVETVDPSEMIYVDMLDQMQNQFGKVLELLRSLPDFILFRLVPEQGRFVMGFGQAYDLAGEGLQELQQVGP